MLRNPAFATTFEARWETLSVAARAAQPGLTLRQAPSGTVPLAVHAAAVALPAAAPVPSAAGAAKQMGISVGTLPRISIDWREPSSLTSELRDGATTDIVVSGLIGEGGMGRVLLGRQRSLQRDVALKTVKQGGSETLAEALIAEGIVTGQLEHPSIIPVHALGLDEAGQPVLVMKRVTGVSWNDLLSKPDHESWAKVPALSDDRLRAHVQILIEVARAVSYAHSKGVLHRDIKPDNVMIGEFGEVYLVDFGVAIHLRDDAPPSRAPVGTPTFMAPELLDDTLPLGPHTDVYLLAATLHTILTGTPRHDGTTIYEVFQSAYASAPVAYANVPEELAELCNHGTRRDPAERIGSALAFSKKLDEFLAHRGSNQLAAAAEERLAELTALAERDLQASLRVGAECRFSYQMALRQWPESPRARAGLTRCLETLLTLELRRENLEAARSLLDELGEAGQQQRASVERLASKLANQKRDADALQSLAHDLDIGVARRQRALFLGVIALVVVAFWVLSLFGPAGTEDGPQLRTITYLALFVLACTVLGIAVLRRELGKNAVNRRLTLLAATAVLLLCLHRVEALLAGATVVHTLSGDLLLLCLAATAATAFVERGWAFGAVLTGIGSVAAALLPQAAVHIFSACLLGLMANVALARASSRDSSP